MSKAAKVLHKERLWVQWPIPTFILFLVASLAIAYGRVYGNVVGLTTLLVGSAVTALLVVKISPTLLITETNLSIGKVSIPRSAIGTVRALQASETKRLLSHPVHGRGFQQIQAGVGTSVLIEIVDECDPHPYWHISTRACTQVAGILNRT